ncbi:substrate-binding domain-containing protein [Clostridium sp. SHJSY1]|uniref:substrate-binding domain-containing protein n=1 Tax=Clostridium sp. SHJSY1 TaxID=2942483 RepID=UPI0028743C2F|nr:substrate-binding domain-containing protein [Clostridium sp. SHJSY1]MDS0526998.1 substrate-binding domain-containing protein [Clostridium sp. SHJSY1]
MRKFKKLLTFTLILILQIFYNSNIIYAFSNINIEKPSKIGVIFYELEHPYLIEIHDNLEKIQKENSNKVNFTFFDCKKNSSIQLDILNQVLEENFDLLILTILENRSNIVDNFIIKASKKDIPLIFYASSIPKTDALKNYPKAYVMNEENQELASMQGKFIANLWNSNRKAIDKNSDNVLQYIQLRGYTNNPLDTQRTKLSIESINTEGIKTEELESTFAYWDTELAESIVSSLFLKYGNKIEAIIATGDSLAVGAVKALQKYGYNKGNKSNTIVVVGFDALPQAVDMIKKGYMAGTFYFDPYEKSKALYDVSMNLISNKNPIEGTTLKINGKNIAITAMPKQYIN